jgi:hypothetical protein
MPLAAANLTVPAGSCPVIPPPVGDRSGEELRGWFDTDFWLWDGQTGDVCHTPRDSEQPLGDPALCGQLARAVAAGSEPEFVADADPVLLLALPQVGEDGQRLAATAAFVTGRLEASDDPGRLAAAAELLGLDLSAARQWVDRQPLWTATALRRVGAAVIAQQRAERRAAVLASERDELAHHLASSYEEISLLHEVCRKLNLSTSEIELGRLALDWLLDVLPAEAVLVRLASPAAGGAGQPCQMCAGHCPLDYDELTALIDELQPATAGQVLLASRRPDATPLWSAPWVRDLILVPLSTRDVCSGWMLALNHRSGGEFGSVEAGLLGTVASVLGIHSGNLTLYREQSELVASVVKALTSAIDAKDPYTCGHSDRVARISVCLAKELGCGPQALNTVYMAGLLHDIGKIGIDDQVLRKPGRLTAAEFEHIKLHPDLGYNILVELKQLADVLPVVRHHHEQWDGSGYPHALAGAAIPWLARIVAVADAFDAMSSDRAYRQGMPLEKVDEVFRAGAGKQWDPQVIDAYFRKREHVRDICGRERANLGLDVQQWS